MNALYIMRSYSMSRSVIFTGGDIAFSFALKWERSPKRKGEEL